MYIFLWCIVSRAFYGARWELLHFAWEGVLSSFSNLADRGLISPGGLGWPKMAIKISIKHIPLYITATGQLLLGIVDCDMGMERGMMLPRRREKAPDQLHR